MNDESLTATYQTLIDTNDVAVRGRCIGRLVKHIKALRSRVEELERLCADHEEVHADKRRLVREIDVIMNGDGAAKQASLCDLVHQIEALTKDAKRYRWLREGDYTFDVERQLRDGRGWLRTEDELDSAIDAAAQGEKGCS
jgi:hypothetical protein